MPPGGVPARVSGVVADGGRRGGGHPGAGMREGGERGGMWSAQGQLVGMRRRSRRAPWASLAGALMTMSRSVLVVTRPSPAACAVQRARL